MGRALRVGVVALTMALVLSGCSVGRTTGPTIVWNTGTPTPPPSVTPPELAPGTVVATGSLVGDERIAGDAAVVVTNAGTFELQLLDFQSTYAGELSVRFSPRRVEPGAACTGSSLTIDYGAPTTEPVQQFPLMKDFTQGDPSFLDTVIIGPIGQAHTGDCSVPVAASAILDWTIPDMRPGLIVHDSGKTGGANGEVTMTDGEPTSYTVTYYDLADEVAARFGITVQDLFYLNPTRLTSVAYPLLETGEVLNLSKADR